MKYYDEKISAKQPYTRWTSHDGWCEGETITSHGIVTITIQYGSEIYKPHTRFDFAVNGFCHIRNYEKQLTRRGAAVIAHKFAKEKAGKTQ